MPAPAHFRKKVISSPTPSLGHAVPVSLASSLAGFTPISGQDPALPVIPGPQGNCLPAADSAGLSAENLEFPKRLPVLLRRAWYGLNQTLRQRIAHLGITPDQFSILRWLSEGEAQGLTQRRLTDLMASDPNTITSTLNRMEKSGLLVREPHERDRRAHRVKLLPRGEQTFAKARDVAMELQEQVLAALPAARRQPFLEELAVIADSCALLVGK